MMPWEEWDFFLAVYATVGFTVMGLEVWYKFRRLRRAVEINTAELRVQRLPADVDREFFVERFTEIDKHITDLSARIYELERVSGLNGWPER